jgi:EAL domain-containing protein (putative c-di-GMP-specific phosphodiesterase class I)
MSNVKSQSAMRQEFSATEFIESVGVTYFPCYQPIIDLVSGEVYGHEALARKRDENEDLQSAAGIFFDGHYPTDFVLQIDRDMRQQALAYFSKETDAGCLSLNISPKWVDQLSGLGVSPTLNMIEASGIDPQRIIIEITERQGNIDKLKRMTKEYQRHGIKVAVDDFGCGASQVDRIVALEPELIKLDMGLFRAACRGGIAADIVLSITGMAKRMGCKIVCEGIETEREFHFAIDCGADFIQGWLYDQAVATPIKRYASVAATTVYKASYLKRKSGCQRNLVEHQLAVFEQIRALSDYLKGAGTITNGNAMHRRMERLGVLRYYLCDTQGNQASPNYELTPEGIQIKSEFAGRNWSHRPYFPLLHGMRGLMNDNIVTSDPYRDSSRGIMCRTCAVWLSGQLMLLTDVMVSDIALSSLL